MESYPNWYLSKQYEGHISRLRGMDKKITNVIHRNTPTLTEDKSNHKSRRISHFSKRSKTQQMRVSNTFSPHKTKTSNMNNLRVPIPLVSPLESTLIQKTINSKPIKLKDKEKILQNYLLSRRILETKSALGISSFQTNNLSNRSNQTKKSEKSLKIVLSPSRQKKFRIYSKQKNSASNIIDICEGSCYLQFQIRHIMLIKGILGRGKFIAYNLHFKIGKQSRQIKALQYQQLFSKTFRIRWKGAIYNKKPQILIFLYVLRENFSQQIGFFRPSITQFHTYSGDQQKKVYRIMKGNFPIGTIQLSGHIIKRKNNIIKINTESQQNLRYHEQKNNQQINQQQQQNKQQQFLEQNFQKYQQKYLVEEKQHNNG